MGRSQGQREGQGVERLAGDVPACIPAGAGGRGHHPSSLHLPGPFLCKEDLRTKYSYHKYEYWVPVLGA
jgi:hypothetical protein